MTDRIKKAFEDYCKHNKINPEGQFAEEDGMPLFEAGYLAAQKEDAALIQQLAGVLQFYMNTGITESLYYKAKEALKAVEEWRKK